MNGVKLFDAEYSVKVLDVRIVCVATNLSKGPPNLTPCEIEVLSILCRLSSLEKNK